MSYTKTLLNNPVSTSQTPTAVSGTTTTQTNTNANSALYKLHNASSGFITNSFPVRRLVRNAVDYEQAWIQAYKAENKKYFEAVLTNQKLDQMEKEEADKKEKVPKRRILKKFDFLEPVDEASRNPNLLDGFFLMQLCCVEDPLDLCSIDISDKELNQVKEEDMSLFENINEINANENNLNFESFKSFPNLKSLNLACNNIKTIRLKHEDFLNLDSLDLSFNNLTPIDVAHLGILKNLRFLKLTGNNLQFLPDTFSKLYVYTKDNKKIVSEKFPNLEELYLDQNQLKEEDSFDVLSVLKKLKRLHLNSNNISCIPNLKIFRKNHVFQEFNKSYYKRKIFKGSKQKSTMSSRKSLIDSKSNEAIVKDLDRPSSEMNIHNSNALRNSFILEEDEEELEEHDPHMTPTDQESKKKLSTNSFEGLDRSFELPFPELVYINLSDNQIAEEDDLIAVASWPLLNEIVLYGNPIVYNNVGYTPLIKQYLIDRLGINIHKIRPLKPLKVPILVPQREHRMVESSVPKVSKVPIETRMLTYYQDLLSSDDMADRSNLSSAESVNNSLNKKRTSDDSFDSGGHAKNDIFKPFKQDKILNSFREESQTVFEAYEENSKQDSNNNDYNSFFMTQGDQDESISFKRTTKGEKETRKEFLPQNFQSNSYDLLCNIENEDQIKVPKDIRASVRALKQMLDHPLILREPCKELDKPQVPLRTSVKNKDNINKTQNYNQPKVAHINEILDTLKERKTITEVGLADALSNVENKKEYERAKRLLEKAQRKYEQVKQESLKPIGSGRKEKDGVKFNFERIKSATESEIENLII